MRFAGIAFFVLAITTAIVDIWLYLVGGTPWTISAWIWTMSEKYAVLPFGVGFVCGHLFWRVK